MDVDNALPANPMPSLDDIVKRYVLAVYRNCGGDKREAAKQLGVSLLWLYRMFDSWGVLSEEFRLEWQDHVRSTAKPCPM